MITLAELQQIYRPQYFEERTGTLNVCEKQKQDDIQSLREIRLTYTGKAIFIKPDFLEDESNIYRKQSTPQLNLRRICDGIILLEQESKGYLLILELKSGYNEVCKKAVEQIVACCQKIRFHLNRFAGFNFTEYEELGIIFSYPPTMEDRLDAENNSMITDRKLSLTGQADLNKERIDREIRTNHQVIVNGEDFGIASLHLSPNLAMQSLCIKHCSVSATVASIDLDELIGVGKC